MIAKRKDEAMKTELAKQAALRAQQDAITAEEQGKANVAEEKYKQEVVKIAAVTVAQKEFEVAQFQAKQALEQKKKLIATGEGEAEAARLKVRAGLTPQEAAEWKYKTDVGVAAELAKVNVPGVMIVGSESGGANPMDMIGDNMALDIKAKLDKAIPVK